VNSRAVRLLELDKILARLGDATATSLGCAVALGLEPSSHLAEVRSRLAHTTEARRFSDEYRVPPFGGITDIRGLIKSANIGGLLEASSLVAVAQFAAGARRLKETIARTPREDYPLLHGDADVITAHPDLEKAILQAIDEETREVRDDASLDLLKARRNMRQTQTQIQSKLRQMLGDPNVQPHLQDAFVTVRDGRYCLPVRADSRARVPGIVHDRSGSGGAFFVEPQAVVELNNRLRELHSEEREAIRAILTELSGRVAGVAEALAPSLESCTNLDFDFAKAQLSKSMDAIEVPVTQASERPCYALLKARHPIVTNCVPNDILLGDAVFTEQASSEVDFDPEEGFDVMLITGPNTGGKTVVLKTLGLLSLMTCCGLHIPVASGSRISIPGNVFADIGDEQSIEQSLSTFSSHIKNIIAILNQSKPGDLILLDEAGAGTDPDEGAALAKAVLRTLQRRGAQVVATTHYGELKQFALSARRFRNASVEFDIKTLRPTYHLRLGVPGTSNALDIAARLGMPNDLVQRARKYLGRERATAEEAAQRLEETQRELTARSASAERERDEAAELRRNYEKKVAAIQASAQREIDSARAEAQTLVRETREEADRILRDLRLAARESKQTEEARGRLRSLSEKTGVRQTNEGVVARITREKQLHDPPAPPEEVAERRGAFARKSGRLASRSHSDEGSIRAAAPVREVPFPSVGDGVRVKSLEKEGVLLSAPDSFGRVDVRVGAIKLQIDRGQIEALKSSSSKPVGGVSAIRIRKSVTVEEEINIIGQTTEEALPVLDKYLDDAILAEAKKVRIVHGKGTGALRTSVHRLLARHRGVVSFALAPSNEGGEGATVAVLDESGKE
jgi:DNA mismatch repair protein MutS2